MGCMFTNPHSMTFILVLCRVLVVYFINDRDDVNNEWNVIMIKMNEKRKRNMSQLETTGIM